MEGCTGLSESMHVKMPHCWKSHVTAHICLSAFGFSNIAFSIPSHFINVPYLTLDAGFFFNTIPVSNSLDPAQARHFVGPDLGPNCLQRLSADNKSCPSGQRVKYDN